MSMPQAITCARGTDPLGTDMLIEVCGPRARAYLQPSPAAQAAAALYLVQMNDSYHQWP